MTFIDRDLMKTTDGLPLVLPGPDILAGGFQLPEPIIEPWLAAGHVAMLYGKTGIGKTMLSYALATTISKGGEILGWQVPEPKRVLYFDAEMDPAETEGRLRRLSGGELPPEFRLVSGIRLKNGLPDLADDDGQAWYELLIEQEQADVVFLDNLCSLVTGGSISEDEVWLPVQPFLNRLRSKRIGVVVVHHAGKRGDYLGSSRMTQNMNSVIKVQRANENDVGNVELALMFEKGRSIVGADAEMKRIKLVSENDLLRWELADEAGPPKRLLDVVEAIRSREYGSQADLAAAMGTAQSVISGDIKKAERMGLLDKNEAASIFREVRKAKSADDAQDATEAVSMTQRATAATLPDDVDSDD
ncbi:AAA family ATPase [Blastochloris tepida]|uniref:AAA family ATPase n=1 Tax=Blastochloris tepida TaxID=2233851 RepID=UPI00135851ED|nr:AAA family ATPase [Blastochloris tepida]